LGICQNNIFNLLTFFYFQLKGEYIGTLGQQDLWDLGDPDTFQAMKPLDVLLAEIEETEDEAMYQKLKDMAMKIISSSSKKKAKIDLIKSGKDGSTLAEGGKDAVLREKPEEGIEILDAEEAQEGTRNKNKQQ
jgi:hypothetical protein